MVGALTELGVTVLMTVEVIESYTDLRFSPHAVSFLTDDIILQRYVEMEGQLRKVLTVVKMRSSAHGVTTLSAPRTRQKICLPDFNEDAHHIISFAL